MGRADGAIALRRLRGTGAWCPVDRADVVAGVREWARRHPGSGHPGRWPATGCPDIRSVVAVRMGQRVASRSRVDWPDVETRVPPDTATPTREQRSAVTSAPKTCAAAAARGGHDRCV